MANNDQANLGGWVEQRLAVLQQHDLWQPDATRALSQLRQRVGAKSTWRPVVAYGCVALATVSLVLFLLASPQPRVFTQRCVDCSLALWESLNRGATSVASAQN